MNSSSHEHKLEQEAPPMRGRLPRQSSIRRLDGKPPQRGVQRNISFCDKVEKKVVERIPRDSFHDVFYDDDEIAEFRHQAFMEECGLDPAEFADE
jgi:hypothetical protein